MLDATTWETITQIIALIGVPGVLLGLFRGYTEITNIKKTRQAQLFMQIYDHMNDPAFQRAKVWLLFETGHLGIDSEEFRYTQSHAANPKAWAGFQALVSYFGGIGVLVHRELLDLDLVYDLLSSHVMTCWERFEPAYPGKQFVVGSRTGLRGEKAADWWKYLYDWMKQYEAEHGIDEQSWYSDREQTLKMFRDRRRKIAEVKARVAAAG